MNKSEIYVEITNEKERLRAIEILKKSGERMFPRCPLKEKNKFGKLTMYHDGEWVCNSNLSAKKTKITLDQLEEMLMPTQYELVGECKGNNDDGCFLDSCGHNCGCFEKIPKSIIETQSNNPLFVAQRYIIDNFPPGTVVTITNGLIEVK
jgi:hypothetical protein